MKKPAPKRILVARTDRLGDVLLSLPSLELLRHVFPDAEIDFVARPEPLEAIAPYLRSRSITPIFFAPSSGGDTGPIYDDGRYDGALYLHAPASLLFAGWRKGVRWRVGMYSKPLSFLLLNQGERQHRTEGGRHEAMYNLELAARLIACLGGPRAPLSAPPIEIPVDPAAASAAADLLQRSGFGAGERFTILHPGMGDSALNLSAVQFVSLVDRVKAMSPHPMLMTMGPAPRDKELVTAIAAERQLPVLSGMRLPVLRELFRRARLVVAPSTGPLHLAHYVGTRTIGLFSPVKSQRQERWAPWGGTGTSSVLYPEVLCPGTRGCLGPRCRHFHCMEKAPWGDLLSKRAEVAEVR